MLKELNAKEWKLMIEHIAKNLIPWKTWIESFLDFGTVKIDFKLVCNAKDNIICLKIGRDIISSSSVLKWNVIVPIKIIMVIETKKKLKKTLLKTVLFSK